MDHREGPDMDILKPALDEIMEGRTATEIALRIENADGRRLIREKWAELENKANAELQRWKARLTMEIESDTLSLLAGTYAEIMSALEAMDKQLRNHAAELPKPIAVRLTDALHDALFEMATLECDYCEGRGDKRLGLIAHKHQVLCPECDQLFATCDGCKDDVLISEAIFTDEKDTTRLYHKNCAPQLP